MEQGSTSAGDTLPVYVLAGGQSRRFGSDKARAQLGGQPLVRHAVRALAPFASRVTVVASRAGVYADLGLRTIGDEQPGRGPLGGLQAALADLDEQEPWLLLASCDRVGLEQRWLRTLLGRWRAAQAAPAVVFRSRQRWQPLPGLYRRELLPLVEQRLRSGEAALHSLLAEAGGVGEPLPRGWRRSVDVNDRSALERASVPKVEGAQGT